MADDAEMEAQGLEPPVRSQAACPQPAAPTQAAIDDGENIFLGGRNFPYRTVTHKVFCERAYVSQVHGTLEGQEPAMARPPHHRVK